jgi:hypothetical protein
MDSIRVSEAPDPGSIPGEATNKFKSLKLKIKNSLFEWRLFYFTIQLQIQVPCPTKVIQAGLPDCVTQAGIPGEAT